MGVVYNPSSQRAMRPDPKGTEQAMPKKGVKHKAEEVGSCEGLTGACEVFVPTLDSRGITGTRRRFKV